MRNISEMGIIQIDVTNVCDRSCSNCTRFCGHFRSDKLYFMELDYYEKAVKSLKDFPGIIGMIGGEPTLHPQFPEMCEILNSHIKDKERKGLWSNTGKKFTEHRDVIDRTFGFFNLNDHLEHEIIHTPILVASEDLLADGRLTEVEWQKYTGSCWIQTTWSATITPYGAYFCEVAAMMDCLFEGDMGWDLGNEPLWWKKRVPEYAEQIAWACRKCGCQIPLRSRRSTDEIDDLTESNLERLRAVDSPKIRNGRYELFTEGIDTSQYRDNVWYWNNKETLLSRARGLCRCIYRKIFPVSGARR